MYVANETGENCFFFCIVTNDKKLYCRDNFDFE